MPRHRSFSLDAAVETAKAVFWDRGYARTAVSDLERGTRLNRSSLYQAFGSKEALFDRALESYISSFIDPLLSPMERRGASVRDIEAFFDRLGELFRSDTEAARSGCLWVNSIAEFAGRSGAHPDRAAEYRQRLFLAFANAQAGEGGAGPTSAATIESRARLLSAITMGAWLMVRIEPREAAATCEAVVLQLRSWHPR